MFQNPVFSVTAAKEVMGCSYGTANTVVEKLTQLGLVQETTGQGRHRRYRYEPYVALFSPSAL
jgi:Fic family protein